MLSEGVLRQLSKNHNGTFMFDFSTINADQYEPLFRTLQRFCLKNVDSVGFSCDELAKFQGRTLEGNDLPPYVLSSIAKKKIHYIRNTVELLCYVVQKSTRLNEVQFSNLTLRTEHLQRLSTAFGKSKALKSLVFSRVGMGDEGIRALLTSLDPNTLESITIVKCGITGACTEDILQFIARRREVGVGLKAFEVSQSEIVDADRRRIQAALTGIPLSPSSRGPAPSGDSDSDGSFVGDRQERIAQLRAENKSLKEQIRALKEMVNAVKFGDSVFVVGKGAPEFVMYLNDVEQRLVTLDRTRRAYP